MLFVVDKDKTVLAAGNTKDAVERMARAVGLDPKEAVKTGKECRLLGVKKVREEKKVERTKVGFYNL